MVNRAILYGVNKYKHSNVPNLRGCINDVENVDNLLVEEFGFDRDDIRLRTDDDVVLRTIERDWEWLVEDAQPGDKLVFHFSGHGSQVTDEDADEEDGVDEILCLYDMDFDNSSTYLIDDQIHNWTKKLPTGVKLTFLLDCCHSGTGTRKLEPGLRAAKRNIVPLPLVIKKATENRRNNRDVKRAANKSSARDVGGEDLRDPRLVIARYLEPPVDVTKRADAKGTRRSVHASRDKSNHVRFSGCKDAQTSADAHINGKFQGAFSAYFCQAIAQHGKRVSHVDLIDSIRDSLQEEGFSQTPQIDPDDLTTTVFEGIESSESTNDSYSEDDSSSRHGSSEIARLVSKIDELIETIQSSSRDRETRRHRHREAAPTRSQSNRRSIVYVHGICWHDEDFSLPWFDAMRPHLDPDIARTLTGNRHEVLWSKYVSSGRDVIAHRSEEEQEIAEMLEDVLQDRAAQSMELQMSHHKSLDDPSALQTQDIDRALLGVPGVDCIDDFVKYLFSSRTRRKVLAAFTDVVQPLLERGDTIDVVSHSWGTVVALEGLHQLDNQSYPGSVSNFFTVGSALSIRPTQRQLKFGAESGDKPGIVDHWSNLDARGDIVGGTLRGFPFEIDEEFLNLPAIGCGAGSAGFSPACAHSSYFNRANRDINRDIFAKLINNV
ncbi:caspase family protein [Novipirellula rosea]|uniref:Peptidase C14 caspase domain-containing protein n=1 Tax=Novipirellula rosea TaxID=1031540 RepID=A0ABP8NDG6_9BACT